MNDNRIVPDGCEQCPNRGQITKKQTGKWGSYILASLITVFVAGYSIEQSPEGDIRRLEDPPYGLWLVCFPAIGLLIGVNIEPEAIASLERLVGLYRGK